MTASSGKLIVLSGPSGVGKTTVVRQLLESCELPLELSVSATTRAPRPGEDGGKSYHFLSRDEFEARRKAGDFLECCEVFGKGHWYGTLRQPVETSLARGKWVILEIDVQGARKVREAFPEVITFFIGQTPEELERRLRGRGTETEERILQRMETARRELASSHEYDHYITNETVGQTVEDICRMLQAIQEHV